MKRSNNLSSNAAFSSNHVPANCGQWISKKKQRVKNPRKLMNKIIKSRPAPYTKNGGSIEGQQSILSFGIKRLKSPPCRLPANNGCSADLENRPPAVGDASCSGMTFDSGSNDTGIIDDGSLRYREPLLLKTSENLPESAACLTKNTPHKTHPATTYLFKEDIEVLNGHKYHIGDRKPNDGTHETSQPGQENLPNLPRCDDQAQSDRLSIGDLTCTDNQNRSTSEEKAVLTPIFSVMSGDDNIAGTFSMSFQPMITSTQMSASQDSPCPGTPPPVAEEQYELSMRYTQDSQGNRIFCRLSPRKILLIITYVSRHQVRDYMNKLASMHGRWVLRKIGRTNRRRGRVRQQIQTRAVHAA